MSTADLILIVLIFLTLIVFLILLIVNGVNVSGQLFQIATNLFTALTAVFDTLTQLGSNLIQSFANFVESVNVMLQAILPKVVTSFQSVSTYLINQLNSMLQVISQDIGPQVEKITGMFVNAFSTVTLSLAQIITQIELWVGGVFVQILNFTNSLLMVLANVVALIIQFLIVNLAKGIAFAIQNLKCIIITTINVVETGISDASKIFDELKADIQGTFTIATQDLKLAIDALTAFGQNMVNGIQRFGWYIACILRCICSKIPLISCPLSCCNNPPLPTCTTFCIFPGNCGTFC